MHSCEFRKLYHASVNKGGTKNRRFRAAFLTLVMILSLCLSFEAYADATDEVVINYLSGWSYIDGDCIYRIDGSALSEEQLYMFLNTESGQWDSIAKNLVAEAFYQYKPVETVTPYALENSGWVSQSISFTYGNDTQTRSFKYKITANITTTNNETTVTSESCNISIPANEGLTYNSLGHIFSVVAESHVTVGFNAEFTAAFSSIITVTKWASMTHNFDI